MKNLRTYLLTPLQQKWFVPAAFTRKLEKAGFTLDTKSCPYKIKQPWDKVEQDDGSVLFRQWDEP